MRYLYLSMAVSLLLLAGCGGPSSATLLREAADLAAEQHPDGWRQALEKTAVVVERGDKSSEALNLYAMCLERNGDVDKALAVALESAERHPDCYLSNYLLGLLLYDRGQFEDAVPPLREAHDLAVEQELSGVDAQLMTTLAAGRAGHVDADRYFRELVQLDTFKHSAEIYNEWGLYWVRQQRADKALGVYNQAKSLPNVDPRVLLNLAIVYDQHLDGVPRRARVEMAKRNYTGYLVKMNMQQRAPDPEVDPFVRQRLNELRLEHVSSNR